MQVPEVLLVEELRERRPSAQQCLSDVALLGVEQLAPGRDIGRNEPEPVLVGQLGVAVTDRDQRVGDGYELVSDHRPLRSMNRTASSSSCAAASSLVTA